MELLRTERLTLRTWRPGDLDAAWSLWGDPAVTRLIGGPFDRAAVAARLEAAIAAQRDHGVQYWPAFTREGALAGCGGRRPHDDPGTLELGFHLRPAFWGRGLAGEAARAVIAYAFDALETARLFAGHHPENVGSARLLARLGFRSIGARLYPPTGLMHPSYERLRA